MGRGVETIEREIDREKQTEREIDRKRKRQKEKQTEREIEREREIDREKQTEREIDRQKEKERVIKPFLNFLETLLFSVKLEIRLACSKQLTQVIWNPSLFRRT